MLWPIEEMEKKTLHIDPLRKLKYPQSLNLMNT